MARACCRSEAACRVRTLGAFQAERRINSNCSIVFVHGLTGKRTRTWLADGAELPWPQALLPEKISEARIITFGYNADVVHFIKPAGQNTVREHARNLDSDLTDLRRQTSSLQRPLIFVAHSLGGLVCEQVSSVFFSYCYP